MGAGGLHLDCWEQESAKFIPSAPDELHRPRRVFLIVGKPHPQAVSHFRPTDEIFSSPVSLRSCPFLPQASNDCFLLIFWLWCKCDILWKSLGRSVGGRWLLPIWLLVGLKPGWLLCLKQHPSRKCQCNINCVGL